MTYWNKKKETLNVPKEKNKNQEPKAFNKFDNRFE